MLRLPQQGALAGHSSGNSCTQRCESPLLHRGAQVRLRWKAFTVRARNLIELCRINILNVGTNVDLSQKLGASAIVGYLPHSHARQCDFGGGVGAAHGASGKMLGPFGACRKLVLPADISDTEFGNLGAKHQAFDGSPGLRVCVIVGRSFVDDLVFTFWLTCCKCEAFGESFFHA